MKSNERGETELEGFVQNFCRVNNTVMTVHQGITGFAYWKKVALIIGSCHKRHCFKRPPFHFQKLWKVGYRSGTLTKLSRHCRYFQKEKACPSWCFEIENIDQGDCSVFFVSNLDRIINCQRPQNVWSQLGNSDIPSMSPPKNTEANKANFWTFFPRHTVLSWNFLCFRLILEAPWKSESLPCNW